MASQSRGRLWALPGSQGLSGAPTSSQPATQPPLGSQNRAHTPLSWRSAATAQASRAAPSTAIPPSAWARAREASLTGASNPSSSLGGRPPPPSDASPRKEHPGAAAAAEAAAAFQRDETADALRVAVERVAKDVARVAEEATACRLANERAVAEMASEVERLARVVTENVKEDGRRSRGAVKAAAAQTAGAMQELAASVQDALASLTEPAKAPGREIIMPEDARQSLHLQMKSLGSDAFLHTGLRRNHCGAGSGEARLRGSGSDDCNNGEGQFNKTLAISASADPLRSSPQEELATEPAIRVPVATLSLKNAQPVTTPLVPRCLSTRQAAAWPQVSEYRMPVLATGQTSITSRDSGDKSKADPSSDEADAEDDDDVFLHDGPLEIHDAAEEHRVGDDGTIAPWEIEVKRDWTPAAVESPADADTCESAEKVDMRAKAKPSPSVRKADRQIGRRRSTRRRS